MFCLDPVDQHFIKMLKYCSATFRPNFFLLIFGEVLEIIEEASMARIFNMNWLVVKPSLFLLLSNMTDCQESTVINIMTTSTLICQKFFCGKTDKN